MISPEPETIVTMKRVINKASHATVAETVARLIAEVEVRGMKLFTTIDHSGEARATNERRAKALAPPPAPRAEDRLRAARPRRGPRMYPVDARPLRPAPSGSAADKPLARVGGLGRSPKAYGW